MYWLRSYGGRRVKGIYAVFWRVLGAGIPTLQFKPMLGAGFERDGWVILSSILLVHLGSLETIIHVAWTLFHEMMFYVLFSAVILSRIFGYSLLGLSYKKECQEKNLPHRLNTALFLSRHSAHCLSVVVFLRAES